MTKVYKHAYLLIISEKIINYTIKFISVASLPLSIIAYFAIEKSQCFLIKFLPFLFTSSVLVIFLLKKYVPTNLKSIILITIFFFVGIYTLFLGLLDMSSLWFILSIIFSFFTNNQKIPITVFISAFILTLTTGLLMMLKNPYFPIDYGFKNCQFACVTIRIINFLIIGFLIFKILKMFFSTIDLYINEIIDKNIVLEQLKTSEKNEAEQKLNNQLLKNNIEKQELELKYKHKELTNAFSKIIQFNTLFEEFKKDFKKQDFNKVLVRIKACQSDNYGVKGMIVIFDELYPQFRIKLQETFPKLTETDINVCILITSGLKSIEIAQILSVTEATVGTYRNRIRKKLEIENNADIGQFLIDKYNSQ